VAPVLSGGPLVEFIKKLCEGGGLIVRVESTGVGKNPGVAVAEAILLEADARIFLARDDTVGTDADECDDSRAPAFDFDFEAHATGAKLVVSEFIGAGGRTFDDVRDAEFEVEQEGFFKGREKARREAATMEGGPEAISRPAEVVADRSGVEAGIDADKEDNEVFGDEIRDGFVVRGEDLSFGGLPRGRNYPIHLAESLKVIGHNPLKIMQLHRSLRARGQFGVIYE